MLLSSPHNATTADPNASGGILNDDKYAYSSDCVGACPPTACCGRPRAR